MLPAILLISAGAQLAFAATLRATARRGSRGSFLTVAVAPLTALALTIVWARIDAGQPFDVVGPEYGVLVTVVGLFIAAGNLAAALVFVSPLQRRWSKR